MGRPSTSETDGNGCERSSPSGADDEYLIIGLDEDEEDVVQAEPSNSGQHMGRLACVCGWVCLCMCMSVSVCVGVFVPLPGMAHPVQSVGRQEDEAGNPSREEMVGLPPREGTPPRETRASRRRKHS